MILGTGREAMGKTPLLNYTWIVRGYFLQSWSKGLEWEQGQRGKKETKFLDISHGNFKQIQGIIIICKI